MSYTKYEATERISDFLDCDDVDSWRVKEWTGNILDILDIGAFLSSVGYKKKGI